MINYKYHIKICHCGKNMVNVVSLCFNYKEYTINSNYSKIMVSVVLYK